MRFRTKSDLNIKKMGKLSIKTLEALSLGSKVTVVTPYEATIVKLVGKIFNYKEGVMELRFATEKGEIKIVYRTISSSRYIYNDLICTFMKVETPLYWITFIGNRVLLLILLIFVYIYYTWFI